MTDRAVVPKTNSSDEGSIVFGPEILTDGVALHRTKVLPDKHSQLHEIIRASARRFEKNDLPVIQPGPQK